MEEEPLFCFDCLERRITSDFDGKLLFSYGLSDCPLPFGSSAVVQMSGNEGEALGAQFVIKYLPSNRHVCLDKYMNARETESIAIKSDEMDNTFYEAQMLLSYRVGLLFVLKASVEYIEENPEGNNSSEKDCTSPPIGDEDEGDIGRHDDMTTSKPPIDEPGYPFDGSRQTNSRGLGLKCSTCTYSYKYSCVRNITALAPIASVAPCSYSNLQELASNFLSGSLEDHILHSLCFLIEGKATGRDGVNFLNLVGVPSFCEDSSPGCLRHPNVAPIIGLLRSSNYINLVLPKSLYTLENILHYSPNVLDSDWDIRFLTYQILSALAYLHSLGFAHGNICPSSIKMSKSCWSWVSICDKPSVASTYDECSDATSISRSISCMENCASQEIYNDLDISQSPNWHFSFERWWRGELSNFEYLLVLNRLAGRRWGDHTFHPVMPWVIDFSVRPNENSDAGWRDLTKSKWRLAKGDEQLDFTYLTSEVPHHVSDECLSELAVCSYKARRLPLSVLRLAVRSVYEPNEYPSTMQRLYQWTPDECIPEFYIDPQIFCSIHLGMTDLAVPPWAESPEEFIQLHRDALESERVSQQIHHWIDITFGYKMSGEAAVSAKNVMLPSSDPMLLRAIGRRQLFAQPHPMRRRLYRETNQRTIESDKLPHLANKMETEKFLLPQTASLQDLEEVYEFSEHARHLNPAYGSCLNGPTEDIPYLEESSSERFKNIMFEHGDGSRTFGTHGIDINYLLEQLEVEDEGYIGYQELLLWRRKSSLSKTHSKEVADDIFAVGCILAELHLRRPLFDKSSLDLYLKCGTLPRAMQELPPQTRIVVEACIQREWTRRPSACSLLESPYFPATIKSSYLFIAPLHLLGKDETRLHYLASFAKEGALRAIGTFAAEKCASSCLPLLVTPSSDTEAEWACTLLKELIKCLTPSAVETLILPAIQKILQTTGYSHLKVSILQDSFVREIWNRVGKHPYLEKLHPLVISNLYTAPHKSSAAAAAVLLLVSSEELGVPITIHQTIMPLIHCFGRGLCPDGIDALVRIGGLLGESFIVRQMLPLLKHVVHSCISVPSTNRPEPVQSWSALALIDCLVTLDGLLVLLPKEVVVHELVQNPNCLHIVILKQKNLEITVLQVAATMLLSVCQRIGPDLTALHVLPQLKELFDELAFSQETASGAGGSVGKTLKFLRSKDDWGSDIETRMDLILLLYPSFALLLGIEKLRQGCATWLLLEQFLLRRYSWKWEYTGESPPRCIPENIIAKKLAFGQGSSSDYAPSKMLLNGVGWSVPQSQGSRSSKNLMPQRKSNSINRSQLDNHLPSTNFLNREPWFWFPSPVISWDGPEFLARAGSVKDELPWKIRASVVYSVRAHHGALRCLAVPEDECAVFTAGIGSGFKGTVQKWDLTRINCISGYYGHEEVVNSICVLSTHGRVASCDGTIHIWNSQTGKAISVFSEPSADSAHFPSLMSAANVSNDQVNLLSSSTLSGVALGSAFYGSLYTCMHHLQFSEILVAGTGSGSLRFIDISNGRKLHLWRGEFVESGFPSLVSALCSCGSSYEPVDKVPASPSWLAAGLSSGNCRLFDSRSGDIISSWRAHDGYITKLAAPEAHLLVSSSLDKTLRIWDLRRNSPSELALFKGHNDGITDFSIWGQDIITISRNKIGLSSLSKTADEDGQGLHRVIPQTLHMGQNGAKNMSVLSSISILPFSRLFLVGTEDGYLRVCC